MAIGYYCPGKVNETSKRVLQLYRYMLREIYVTKESIKSKRECIRLVGACREFQINIGAVNYYERSTAINILRFLVDQTINLCLIV